MRGRERGLVRTKRLVVKVGSSSLTHPTGKLNLALMENLVRQMADLYNSGREVILVTSGAIGVGLGKLRYTGRPKTIPEKQAAAAVGQGILMQMYEKFFAEYGVTVGQVLLTREDFSHRRRFLNARNTLHALLHLEVIPVINENDTVAVDEIKLGDNDNLAALVGVLVDAQLLVLLSDVDGLYTGDPRKDPGAVLIRDVEELTGEIEALAGGAGTGVGTGGMITKIQAARVGMHCGLITVIANAGEQDALRRIIAGEQLGTAFWPSVKMQHKKSWIAYSSAVHGKIHVDEGAARALLKNGKSLLPSGIVGVEGNFDIGNTVAIFGPDNREIGRGIVNYSADEVARIKGVQTKDIERVLGYKDYDEVIHRNNLALEL
ncbi:MAG: glutamate 5-kinase [Bacillota bacterium]